MSGARPGRIDKAARKMTMEITINQQSLANMEYVRRLLWQKERRFSAALELAVIALERELTSATLPGGFACDFERYAKPAGTG
jgi:hypothetical protein